MDVVRDITVRDMALIAMAELDSYGITALDGLPGTPTEARAAVAVHLARVAPHGMGSYVFWLAADERCFDDRGELVAPLPLHTSGADVEDAVAAAFAHAGLVVTADRTVLPG
jgi:hypothetical protein